MIGQSANRNDCPTLAGTDIVLYPTWKKSFMSLSFFLLSSSLSLSPSFFLENASAFKATLISEQLSQTKSPGATSTEIPRQNTGTVNTFHFHFYISCSCCLSGHFNFDDFVHSFILFRTAYGESSEIWENVISTVTQISKACATWQKPSPTEVTWQATAGRIGRAVSFLCFH